MNQKSNDLITVGGRTLKFDEKTSTYVRVSQDKPAVVDHGKVPRLKRPKFQKHKEDSKNGGSLQSDNRPKKKKDDGRCNHKFRLSATIYMSDRRLRDLDGVLSTAQDCLRDAVDIVGNPEGLPHDDNRFWISEIGSVKFVEVDTDAEAGIDITLERLTESGGIVVCQSSNQKPVISGSALESQQLSLL